MKKLTILVFAAALLLCGCAQKEPFFTAGENDAPRILNTDIPEWKNDQPAILTSVDRNSPFTFDLVVTPEAYTTVTWFDEDTEIAQGKHIETLLGAGSHKIKAVATTTKGLSTSRTFYVVVRPLEADPVLENVYAKRGTTVGATAVLSGANLGGVTKVLVGGKEAAITSKSDTKIEITVPEMADGEYKVTLEEADGTYNAVYEGSAGHFPFFTLFVGITPPVVETTIWEGSFAVTWAGAFDGVKETLLDKVAVGSIVSGYVTATANNAQGCMATSWWNNIYTGKNEADRGDVAIKGDMVLTYEITQAAIDLLTAQNGPLFVGDGYTITRVTVK